MTNLTDNSPKLVRDLMSVGVVTCSPNTKVRTIAQAIIEKDIEGVIVLDTQGHALGIVGQEELVKAYTQGDYEDKVAQEVMRDEIPQIPPDIPITAAAHLMLDQRVRVFFLTHHAGGVEYPAALITFKHILRYLSTDNTEELKDLGIKAERKAPLDLFIERREQQKKQNLNIHLD